MKVWITKKTVTLGSRSQVGFKAIGRNLCESGSLFWRAGGGKAGDWTGSSGWWGWAEQCLSIPYHPVSRAKRIIQVCINARVLLPFCLSVSELTTPTQSDKFQKLFFWDGALRQPLRVYSTTLSIGRVNVSGWPSGLRRQTQASASHLWGFWSPSGGVGSNPTSDTSSFCSYDFQNKSIGQFLIFSSRHSNISGPWPIFDSENSPVKESWSTFRITWRQPPALPSEIPSS